MKLIVDADPLVYGMGFAAEGEPMPNALNLVKTQLNKYKDEFGSDHLEVYLSGSRKDLIRTRQYPDYKTSRESKPKPEHYQAIRDYLVDVWGAKVQSDIEADDAVCIDAFGEKGYSLWDYDEDRAELDEIHPQCIIISIDKDLDQCPGWHYKPNKEIFYYIDRDTAGLWWACQMLMGDAGDDIEGIPGIGPAKAKKLLLPIADWASIDDLEVHTAVCYHDYQLTEEDLLRTRDLVTMIQDEKSYGDLLRDFAETTNS